MQTIGIDVKTFLACVRVQDSAFMPSKGMYNKMVSPKRDLYKKYIFNVNDKHQAFVPSMIEQTRALAIMVGNETSPLYHFYIDRDIMPALLQQIKERKPSVIFMKRDDAGTFFINNKSVSPGWNETFLLTPEDKRGILAAKNYLNISFWIPLRDLVRLLKKNPELFTIETGRKVVIINEETIVDNTMNYVASFKNERKFLIKKLVVILQYFTMHVKMALISMRDGWPLCISTDMAILGTIMMAPDN